MSHPLSHLAWDSGKYCYFPDIICIAPFNSQPKPLINFIRSYQAITDEHLFHKTFYKSILDTFLADDITSSQLYALVPDQFHIPSMPTSQTNNGDSRTVNINEVDLKTVVEDYKTNWSKLPCVNEVRRVEDEKRSHVEEVNVLLHSAGEGETEGAVAIEGDDGGVILRCTKEKSPVRGGGKGKGKATPRVTEATDVQRSTKRKVGKIRPLARHSSGYQPSFDHTVSPFIVYQVSLSQS